MDDCLEDHANRLRKILNTALFTNRRVFALIQSYYIVWFSRIIMDRRWIKHHLSDTMILHYDRLAGLDKWQFQ